MPLTPCGEHFPCTMSFAELSSNGQRLPSQKLSQTSTTDRRIKCLYTKSESPNEIQPLKVLRENSGISVSENVLSTKFWRIFIIDHTYFWQADRIAEVILWELLEKSKLKEYFLIQFTEMAICHIKNTRCPKKSPFRSPYQDLMCISTFDRF